MAKLLYVEPGDEITDLVDKIRRAEQERDLVFVVPSEARVLRSPLDMQLLMQYTRGFQKRSAIVSEDPQVQALAMRTGFTTFASISGLEQGASLDRPEAATGAIAGGAVAAAAAPAAVAAATAPSAPAARPAPVDGRPAARTVTPAPAPAAVSRRSGAEVLAPAAAGDGWWHRRAARNSAIGAGVGLFIVALIAVLILVPTATVTVSVPAHLVQDTFTLQGVAGGGGGGGTLGQLPVRALQTPTSQGTFQVTPTGTNVLPAVPATGTIDMCVTGAHGSGVYLVFASPPEFQDTSASGTVDFTTTSASGSNGYSVPSCSSVSSGASAAAVPVQADPAYTVGTQGNVGPGQSWNWTNVDSSATVYGAAPNTSFTLSNPAAMTGGSNSTTQTVFTSSDQASAQAAETKLISSLTTKVEQQLRSLAGHLVIAQDASGNGIQVSDTNPTIPSAGQVGSTQTLTVSVSASATAYSPAAAKSALLAELRSKVPTGGELLANYQLSKPQVETAAPGGVLTLQDHAVGYWAPRIDLTPYRSKLAFMTPAGARSYLMARLSGASAVGVSQTPFSLPWLPLLSSHISLVRKSVSAGGHSG